MNLQDKIKTDPYYKRAAEIITEQWRRTGQYPTELDYHLLAQKLKEADEQKES